MTQPSASFQDAAYKILWAKINIQHLTIAIASWLKENLCEMVVGFDQKRGENALVINLVKPLPINFMLMAGDICGNLRASLDFAWMGLVRSINPGNPERRTMPISLNRRDLENTIRKAPIGNFMPGAIHLLRDVIGSHRDASDGGNIPLIALNELSNWNKHNMLIGSIGCMVIKDSVITDDNGDLMILRNTSLIGASGSYISFGEIPNGCHIRHIVEPEYTLIFEPHGTMKLGPVIHQLTEFLNLSVSILKSFCCAFPDNGNPTFS